jgi:hypothetical protein
MRRAFVPVYLLATFLCAALLILARCRTEELFVEEQKARSIVTPQAEHLFAKTCHRRDEAAVRRELQALAARYEQASFDRWNCRCSVRWECESLESLLFADALDIRVFVKQQPSP